MNGMNGMNGMRKIKLPGSSGGMGFIHTGSDKDAEGIEQALNARHAFALKYAKEKGWGGKVAELSLDQIMEIRRQEGWKNPK